MAVRQVVTSPRPPRARRGQGGATLIEVLVTIVIVVFGLLGLAGLQMRLQTSELEAYQRTQALLLLNDMSQRITVNRNNIASYVTGTTAVGAGMNCPTTTGTTVQKDVKEWCEALQGGKESITSGGVTTKVGHMIGGRGCVENLGGGDYMITVAWQGMIPVSAPPASVACGKDQYNGGSTCVSDMCRRTVTTIVRVGTLL